MSQEEKSDSVESIIEEDTGTSTRMKSIFVVFVTGNMLMVNYGTSVINAAIVSGCLHKYEQTYKKSDLTVLNSWKCQKCCYCCFSRNNSDRDDNNSLLSISNIVMKLENSFAR